MTVAAILADLQDGVAIQHAADRVLLGTARWDLHRGESLRWLGHIPDACVDGLVTDPPYSSGGAFRGDRAGQSTDAKYVQTQQATRWEEFAGDTRDQRGFLLWCTLWLSECLRVVKPGGVCAVFSDWRQLPTMTDAIQAGGWVWRGIIPWDKTEGVRPQLGRPRTQAEFIVWGSNGALPVARDAPTSAGVLYTSEAYDWETVGSTIREPHDRSDKHHMAGKPTGLMRDVVKIVERGGIILDPFAGSGTTGVAALLEGRRFLGCELTEHYHGVGRARLLGAAGEWERAKATDVQPTLFGGKLGDV